MNYEARTDVGARPGCARTVLDHSTGGPRAKHRLVRICNGPLFCGFEDRKQSFATAEVAVRGGQKRERQAAVSTTELGRGPVVRVWRELHRDPHRERAPVVDSDLVQVVDAPLPGRDRRPEHDNKVLMLWSQSCPSSFTTATSNRPGLLGRQMPIPLFFFFFFFFMPSSLKFCDVEGSCGSRPQEVLPGLRGSSIASESPVSEDVTGRVPTLDPRARPPNREQRPELACVRPGQDCGTAAVVLAQAHRLTGAHQGFAPTRSDRCCSSANDSVTLAPPVRPLPLFRA